MRLKVIKENISTGKTNIAILHISDAEKLDLFPGDRVKIKLKKNCAICIVDIAYSKRLIHPGRIILYKESAEKVKVKTNDILDIEIAKSPKSIHLIKKKLAGFKLNKKEFEEIIKDIVKDNLSDIELTYFIAACSAHNLTLTEVKYLINAIVSTGLIIKPNSKIVLDKHCVGGVAGNRTTMVVTPILAAAGYTVPKTSSKAITSPAGTANTMECLANVCLTKKQIEYTLDKVGACMVWGGALNLAPADDKIIRIEHPLSIDVSGLLLSSIMSKKISVSATHLLIDIPWGAGSKFETKNEALLLKRKFELICKLSGIKCKVILTDGRSPIGYGLGPLLEAIDVMKVLENKKDAPQDLKDKSLMLAGELFDLVGKTRKGKGKLLAKKILEDGSALKKMKEIIKFQGEVKKPSLGRFKKTIYSKFSGKIKRIDNKHFSKLAKIAGAPGSKGAGVFILINLNEKIAKKQELFIIYASNKEKLKYATEFYIKNKKEFIDIS